MSFPARKIKHYPHFDAPIPLSEIEELVNDPIAVARHKFYPFFLYENSWQPFRLRDTSSGKKPEIKSRPIRYAARKDAYILTHYREILSEKCEGRLKDFGIADCPIAYRALKKAHGGGKCNIDFAKDAFDTIKSLPNSIVVALDIKGYFENLDHRQIKTIWQDLLGVTSLPEDHFTVFKNITRYHVVDQKDVLRRLGILVTSSDQGYPRDVYKMAKKDMPRQLCTPSEFREKIAGGDINLPSIIRGNTLQDGSIASFGIPQGAPISDLIANFYLIDFDVAMNDYAKSIGGTYVRYSDDILIISPSAATTNIEATSDSTKIESTARNLISQYGGNLTIKESKTCVAQYVRDGNRLNHRHIKGDQGRNGVEYLGFRFDGAKVYIRDSTMSRLYRKVSRTAIGIAVGFARSDSSLDADSLLKKFNYSKFSQRYSRVLDETLSGEDYSTWTFYSYLKRASETFGGDGDRIMRQARNFNTFMRSRFENALRKAVVRRDKKPNLS